MLDIADPTLLTPSEVSRRLELSVSRVRQLVLAGQLKAIDTRLGRLYSEDAVAAFIRGRAQHAGAGAGQEQAR